MSSRPSWKAMSITAVLGGAVGALVGTVWLSPGILIPIGVVIGLAVVQAARRGA